MQKESVEEEKNSYRFDFWMLEWLSGEGLYRRIRGCLEMMQLFRRKVTYQGSVRLKFK